MTKDDVRKANAETQFLQHVWRLIRYWDKVPMGFEHGISGASPRLEGLAFCILAALDGKGGSLAPFTMVPNQHHLAPNISGDLQEKFYELLPAGPVTS